jgi:flagellar motility protein MotE (MotC chaperone)
MSVTRRGFVLALGAAASIVAARDTLVFAQRRPSFPKPPEPSDKNPSATDAVADRSRQATKKALQENERDFRAGTERLYQLAAELRDEVKNTAASDVLSVRMYKKAEEIEKLAKHLKSKAKG